MSDEKTQTAGQADEAGSFEEKLRRIEALAEELERGELPMERALNEFERGMRLIETARRELEAAEQRVRLITATGEEQPFEGAAPSEGA